MLPTQSDTRLTDLARAGSEPAFEAIVARYRRSLVRYCARVVGDADAEEATQDALMKAHAALLRGDPVRRLAPWLHVIAHNTALSYLRARSSRPQPADVDCECSATIDVSGEHREELNEVLEAVRSLPDRQRSAIVMRELEGRSYDEIAARLGSSHGAVRQLLNRARCSVRERLGALIPVEPLVRWALTGASGAEAAGGATMSGACVLGAKACAAALLPATVALIASASAAAPRHKTTARVQRTATPVTYVHRAGEETPLPAAVRPAVYTTPAGRPASTARSKRAHGLAAASGSGTVTRRRNQRGQPAGSSPAPAPSSRVPSTPAPSSRVPSSRAPSSPAQAGRSALRQLTAAPSQQARDSGPPPAPNQAAGPQP